MVTGEEINNVLLLIGVIVGAIIVLGLVIFVISNIRTRNREKNSMPTYGQDRSEFGRNLKRRYQNTDKK